MLPILAGSAQLRKKLEATGAIQQLQEGRPDRFSLLAVQAAVNEVLRARKIEPNSQRCDEFLIEELSRFKDELNYHEVAIIASCHVLSHDQVRGQLIRIRPDVEFLREVFLWKLKAYVQCLFHCQKANSTLFLTCETVVIIELLHIVIPAGSKRIRPVWKLLRVVGDDKVQELFSIKFVKQTLLQCGYWYTLNSELKALRSARKWSEAWILVKGIRGAVASPKIQEILREALDSYSMWAAWAPDENRINGWNVPALSGYRERLALLLDLEGPDTTGNQHRTLRGALVHQDDSVQIRALQAVSAATRVGAEGVECLVEFCANNKTITENNVELLESILKLGVPGRIAQAKGLFRFAHNYISTSSVNQRISLLVYVLSIVHDSPQLQRILNSTLNLPRCLHETLTAAQTKARLDLLKGSPDIRLATNISLLARTLVTSRWLQTYWTPAYNEMLRQVPSEAEVTKRIKELPRATTSVRERHVAYLIEKLCAGPSAKQPASPEPHDMAQAEDPIWLMPMDVDRERLRHILRGKTWMDKATATACVKRSVDEDDSFVQELNTIINDDTDQVCVNLARYLGPVVVRTRRLDPCWKRLLLSMMRRRPRGLLDRMGETQSLQSWQNWLNNLRHIYGEGHLDPEGQLGFTKAKILQWERRKMTLSRAASSASTSTKSTGISGASLFSDVDTTGSATTPESSFDPFRHSFSLRHLQKPPAAQANSSEPEASSVAKGENIPWYEREIGLLNASKPHAISTDDGPGKANGFVDEDIYD
jgi:hypothetical protein